MIPTITPRTPIIEKKTCPPQDTSLTKRVAALALGVLSAVVLVGLVGTQSLFVLGISIVVLSCIIEISDDHIFYESNHAVEMRPGAPPLGYCSPKRVAQVSNPIFPIFLPYECTERSIHLSPRSEDRVPVGRRSSLPEYVSCVATREPFRDREPVGSRTRG